MLIINDFNKYSIEELIEVSDHIKKYGLNYIEPNSTLDKLIKHNYIYNENDIPKVLDSVIINCMFSFAEHCKQINEDIKIIKEGLKQLL